MSNQLLQTKLHIPQLRAGEFITRPRLIEQLNNGLHRKLTLISAAAGSGKTTLVADWLEHSTHHKTNRKIVWLSLSREDNDFTRFLAYLAAALQKVEASLGQTVSELLQSSQLPQPEIVITHLLNDLATYNQPLTVVLDDYHFVTEESIHRAWQFWLENSPSNAHLIITTRTDPPFPLALMRARRHMTELRGDDLRFQADEISQFFAQTMHLTLSPPNVAVLEARTEGWVAGLQMAGLSLQGHSDVTAYLDQFSGSQRYIFDYLADQVLSQCVPETRDFLLRTALLNRMCASLCDAVLEAEGSQTTLESLEEANFFLIPLDDERHWYRYHHLFADLLRHHLQRERASQVPMLHHRASLWFEQAGLTHEAIEHALHGNDLNRAAELIEPIAHGMAYRVEVKTLGGWVETLPDDLLMQYPGIVYPYAIVLSLARRFDDYQSYLERIESAAQASIDQPQAQMILGQIGIQQSIRLHLFGDYEQALERVVSTERTLQQYAQPDERWELISITGYSTLHLGGQVDEALGNLEKAIRLGTADEGPMGALLCNTFAANAYLYLGQLQKAESHLRKALKAVTTQDNTHLFPAVFPKAMLGRVAYERNQLDEAAQYVNAYFPLTTILGFTIDPIDTLFVSTMLPLARGEPNRALDRLRQAEQEFETLPISGSFALRLEAIKALVWLRLGELENASRWADTVVIPESADQLQPLQIFPYLVWARIQLAQRHFALVEPLLTLLHHWADDRKLNGILLETTMIQALQATYQNEAEVANAHIRQALFLAKPGEYMSLFIDEGEPMAQLLRQEAKREKSPYLHSLLAAFEERSPLSSAPRPAPSQQDLIEPLTPRELELIALLAEGYTNQEIANRLIIAVSTVKRHAINIYGKLGVRNRTEAVATARKLNLL